MALIAAAVLHFAVEPRLRRKARDRQTPQWIVSLTTIVVLYVITSPIAQRLGVRFSYELFLLSIWALPWVKAISTLQAYVASRSPTPCSPETHDEAHGPESSPSP